MKNNKSNLKNLKYISTILMVIIFLIGLLLPLPYEGKESSVFFLTSKTNEKTSDIRSIILFEFGMLVSFGWALMVYNYANVPEIEDVQLMLNKMESNRKIPINYSQTLILSLEDAKSKNKEELIERDLFYAKQLEIKLKERERDFKTKMELKNKEIAKMEKDFNLVSKIKDELDEDDEE